MEITDLKLQDSCTAWVHDYAEADEQEQGLIIGLANAITHSLKLIEAPDFLLEIEERNCTKGLTTMRFKIARVTADGICALSAAMPKILFQTTASQDYSAKNHDNSDLDYKGRLKVSVSMEGVWDNKAKCHTQNEKAEIALKLACGCYYEEILRHYPEWKTAYKDAPKAVTLPIEHL